eukprot:2365274-Pyramimonas_sp.AAC.1
MGIGVSPLSSSCKEPSLRRAHMAWIFAPITLKLSLRKIPTTSTVPGGSAAKLRAARAYDWKVKPSSFIFCTRSPK